MAVRHKVIKLVVDMMNEDTEELARATHYRKDLRKMLQIVPL